MQGQSIPKHVQKKNSPPLIPPPSKFLPLLSRRERRKIATREALIKAAQEVIAAKGVYLAVIEEITERADVAKGSFYQHFHDRDDLLQTLLARHLNELQTLIEGALSTGTLAERIHRLIHLHLEYFLRHEDFLLFLHQIRGLIKMKGEETPVVRDTYRRHLTFLAEQLQPHNGKAPYHERVREEGACALLGLLTGFLSHYALFVPLSTLKRDMKRIESTLASMCRTFWQ